jgi:hypothetical protein
VTEPGGDPTPPDGDLASPDRDLASLARSTGRFVVAVVVSAAVATVIFLIMVQGSFRKGYTDLDFNHVVGTVVKGTASEAATAHGALGVVGDTAGPSGLYSAFVGAAVLLALYGLVTHVVHRHWVVQGLGLGVVTFLVLGLVFAPIADARLDTPTGLFGVDAGGFTVVVLGVSALGFGLVAARCYDLIQSAHWWRPTEATLEEVLEAVGEVEVERSLELPEERPEQGGMRA